MMNSNSAFAAQRGFALVEALVTLAILSVGLLGLAQMQAQMTQHSALARQQVQAMALAQGLIERWRADAERPTVNASSGLDAIADGADRIEDGAATFDRRWAVNSVAGAKAVAVRIMWPDRTGREQSVQLRTMIAPGDARRAALLMSPLSPAQSQFGAEGRPVAVPVNAVPLTGSSRWFRQQMPMAGDGGSWLVFDARTGDVAFRCNGMPSSVADLSSCLAVAGRLVSGTVLLGSDISLTAIQLALTDAATVACTRNLLQPTPPGSLRATGFVCLAPVRDHDRSARTAAVWSGRLVFATQSSNGEAPRVCRYAHNASQSDGQYVDVEHTLLHQNHHLSTEVCPAGTAEQR